MPKLFEYFGIVCKAEFYILNGEIEEIRIKRIKDKKTLKQAQLKDFKLLLKTYGNQIVSKWIDHFVYHKTVTFEQITTKIK